MPAPGPDNLGILAQWEGSAVRVRCGMCRRVLGQLFVRVGRDDGRPWDAYLTSRHAIHAKAVPAIADGRLRKGSRPQIGEVAWGPPSSERVRWVDGVGYDDMRARLSFTWRCKCGRDHRRNGARLVPAFVRCAQAGSDLWLE